MLRAIFIGLSENQALRRFAERSPIGLECPADLWLERPSKNSSRRRKGSNRLGIRVSVDNLGENVTNREEALASAKLYHQILDEIEPSQTRCQCKPQADAHGSRCRRETRPAGGDRTGRARGPNPELHPGGYGRLAYTQRTLDFVRELHRQPGCAGRVGTVLQAYMRRTMDDAKLLVSEGIRIRLCKGAYKEPPEIAFQAKSEVDANYLRVAKYLLKSGVFHGLATHDQAIITEIKSWAKAEGIAPSAFEFQMLHGVRRDLQEKLAQEGWGVRVYLPFGTEWYPYFMRRLAERPANVWFIAKNLLRG